MMVKDEMVNCESMLRSRHDLSRKTRPEIKVVLPIRCSKFWKGGRRNRWINYCWDRIIFCDHGTKTKNISPWSTRSPGSHKANPPTLVNLGSDVDEFVTSYTFVAFSWVIPDGHCGPTQPGIPWIPCGPCVAVILLTLLSFLSFLS